MIYTVQEGCSLCGAYKQLKGDDIKEAEEVLVRWRRLHDSKCFARPPEAPSPKPWADIPGVYQGYGPGVTQ